MTGFHEGTLLVLGQTQRALLESQKGTVHFGKGLARTLVPIMIYCACAELCNHVGSCENSQKYASGEQVSLDKMKPLKEKNVAIFCPPSSNWKLHWSLTRSLFILAQK